MHLTVDRVASDEESTLGRLYIDGAFECYTLEDQYREGPKVKAETRIPAGVYRVELREEGGYHGRYTHKFAQKNGDDWHAGMLHVQDVPGFEYILIHIGNSHDNTAGCLLVGTGHSLVGGYHYITSSTLAYEAMYPKVRDALLAGETVSIEYKDLDEAAANKTKPDTEKSRAGLAAAGTTAGGAVVAGAGAADVYEGEGLALEGDAPARDAADLAETPTPAPTGETPETPAPAPTPPEQPTPAAPPADVEEDASQGFAPFEWLEAFIASENTIEWLVLIFGVLIVLLGIYLLLRRWQEWRRRKRYEQSL